MVHNSSPISGIEAMVHNLVGDEYGNHGQGDEHDDHENGDEHDDHENGDEQDHYQLWLFYSYRNFLKKHMQYNMHLRGKFST